MTVRPDNEKCEVLVVDDHFTLGRRIPIAVDPRLTGARIGQGQAANLDL